MDAKRKGLQRLIHGACRELGIDGDTRRDLQLAASGKASMTAMDAADLRKVVDALKARGWKPEPKPDAKTGAKPGGRKWRAPESRADLRLIWVLWGKLAEAGHAQGGEAALQRFVNSDRWWRKWGHAHTHLKFLPQERAADVIEALKDICNRHQVRIEK